MRAWIVAGSLLVAASGLFPAQAESLRCAGASVAEGDSRLSLLAKCGPPALSDHRCAPVYFSGTLHPVPEPFGSAFVPCQLVEDWLYDRGPGHLPVTVRLRSGVVQSIRYGQPR